jgi:hypothetical protein
MQAFSEAAEGIRTLDLLHGKQNVRRRLPRNMPANRRVFGTDAQIGFPGIPREFTGVSGSEWVVEPAGS